MYMIQLTYGREIIDPSDGVSVFDQIFIHINRNKTRSRSSQFLRSGVCSVRKHLHTKNLTKYWKRYIHGAYVQKQPLVGELVTFSQEELVNRKVHR